MMRWNFVMIAVLALPLAASADGLLKHTGCESGDCGGGVGGKHGWFHGHTPAPPTNVGHGHGLCQPPFQAAPWYLYWPYDQHFQMPAPINAPFIPPQSQGYAGGNPYFTLAR